MREFCSTVLEHILSAVELELAPGTIPNFKFVWGCTRFEWVGTVVLPRTELAVGRVRIGRLSLAGLEFARQP